jgi:RimJ/RimL family protein N-acetyltransferase
VNARLVLRDARAVQVRRVDARDEAKLQAFVAGLSWPSRTARFLAPIRELSPSHLRAILSSPGLSLAAFDDRDGIVALAQYALARENANGEAEFAVVVAEAWRNRGLAEALLGLLRHDAERRGARHLVGVALPHNDAMRNLADKLGLRLLAAA